MNEEEMFKNFGENVRKQREKENITLEELSKKTKIRKQYLKKIENGKATGMPCFYLLILAQALNTKASELCKFQIL